jgi:hypothetical protein
MLPMKYWEIVGRKLSAAGWTWGYCSSVTRHGWRWTVDAYRGDRRRYIIQSDDDNTATGFQALLENTTGPGNTAIGSGALQHNVDTAFNTAIGIDALFRNRAGANTAIGAFALLSNTDGTSNTASGFDALTNNTTGNNNTATGYSALSGNGNGSNNTATGYLAASNGGKGNNNTATGSQALLLNSGSQNTATGVNALLKNHTIGGVSGSFNTATGFDALLSNTTGDNNTATGVNALQGNTTGAKNTASGVSALAINKGGGSNTAFGNGALGKNTTGSFNTALGSNAGANLTTGNDNIDIGAVGVAGESGTMRFGTAKQIRTFITGIRGVTTTNANAVPVVIDSTGQLGTVSSSARFKDQIEPMNSASEGIMALKPVTFRYKSDKQNTPQFGLIAEEVAKVNPDLVVRDDNGEIYTVRYDAVNAMLLNEFLKEHTKVQALQSTVAQQQKQIEALTTGLQKVSAAVELKKATATEFANTR